MKSRITLEYLCCLLVISVTEAERQEQINKATGEAAALLAVAEARAKSLRMVADSLSSQVCTLLFFIYYSLISCELT